MNPSEPLSSQYWDYKHPQPCVAFFVDTRKQTRILVCGTQSTEPSCGWYLFSGSPRLDKYLVFQGRRPKSFVRKSTRHHRPTGGLSGILRWLLFIFTDDIASARNPSSHSLYQAVKTILKVRASEKSQSWKNIILPLIDCVDRKAIMIPYYLGRLWLVSTPEPSKVRQSWKTV